MPLVNISIVKESPSEWRIDLPEMEFEEFQRLTSDIFSREDSPLILWVSQVPLLRSDSFIGVRQTWEAYQRIRESHQRIRY